MRIGIIGGGVNGLCCAWELAQAGHNVSLFERNALMHETSSSSSKLLHGGLRYLENYEFRLVREALKERDAWIERVPKLAKTIRLVMPVYSNSSRGKFILGAGLFLYDNLIGKSKLPKSKWLSTKEVIRKDPKLKTENLKGGYEFSDGQMDDYALGMWIADQAKKEGAKLNEFTDISMIDCKGNIYSGDKQEWFDIIVNVAGPWTNDLLAKSNIESPYKMDIVRGSHLVIKGVCNQSYLLEMPKEKRVFFVLPWKGHTLIGTTEVRQDINEAIECSSSEKKYLLDAYSHYFKPSRSPELIKHFAGARPLIFSKKNPTKTSREYAIQQNGRLINVFGGKWTTSLALARKVRAKVSRIQHSLP